MRILQKVKDGGPESPVDAYILCEFKSLFTIALLKFNKGSREAYHTHAFNALTWFLEGKMTEVDISQQYQKYKRSLVPKFTSKDKNHRVVAHKDSWALTLRGPWENTWTETLKDKVTTFTHGRKVC